MKHFIVSVCTLLMGVLGFVSCSDDEDPKEVLYTVTFNSSGGSEVPSQTVKPGELVNKPDDPTKSGEFFMGWFTNESYEKEWDFMKDVVNSDMTLFAQWKTSKEALAALVKEAEAMKNSDYSYYSFKCMTFKLKETKEVLNNAAATEEDFSKAYQEFSFVVERMIPVIKGKEGPKALVVGASVGYVKDDVVMIYPKVRGNYPLNFSVYFNVIDELGYSDPDYYEGLKLDYDKEALKSWTIDGNLTDEYGYIEFIMKPDLQSTEKEIKITATLGEISRTVTLKIYDFEMVKNEFKSEVNSYPQGEVTFDNAVEFLNVNNNVSKMLYGLVGFGNEFDLPQEEVDKHNKVDLIDWYYTFSNVSEFDGDYILVGKDNKYVYGYDSEGEFPTGKIYGDWWIQYDYNQVPDENGERPILDINLPKYELKKDGKFAAFTYWDSKKDWVEDASGEYKFDGENIIIHITSNPTPGQKQMGARIMTHKNDFRNIRMR